MNFLEFLLFNYVVEWDKLFGESSKMLVERRKVKRGGVILSNVVEK